MNILFITAGTGVDYQNDLLYNGLCKVPNITVYTNTDMWYLFKGTDKSEIQKQYGKGFSVCNKIDPEFKHIETIDEIKRKIEDKYYNKIIYGSIKRCTLLLDKVLSIYSKNDIAIIDGEDYDIATWVRPFMRSFKKSKRLINSALYFMREIKDFEREYFYPIFFAIPDEIIIKEIPQKINEWSFITPKDKSTYIYKEESAYYNDYATSKYALTKKKAGWDCLRHYEILANACIPYFPNIKNCPHYTMLTFPKNIIIETNKLIETNMLKGELYDLYNNYLLEYTHKYLTTSYLAKYLLSYLIS